MPGIDNKIFLKTFRSAHQGRHFKPRLKSISVKNLLSKATFSWKMPAFATVAA